MKVKDLMEICKDLNQDTEVVIPDFCCIGHQGDYVVADGEIIDAIDVGHGWYDRAKDKKDCIKVLKIW